MVLRQQRYVTDRSRELVDGDRKVQAVYMHHIWSECPHAVEQPTWAARQGYAARKSSGHAPRIVYEMEGDPIALERLALA
jgi:hypothetical protein